MENIDALQNKIYQECMEVIQVLAKTESRDELISKNYLVSDLFQHISFMQLLEQNRDVLVNNQPSQSTDSEDLNSETEHKENSDVNESYEEIPLTVTNQAAENESDNNFEVSEPENETENISFKSDNHIVTDSNLSHEIFNENSISESEITEQEPEFTEELIDEELIAESVINEDSYERAVEIKEQETEPEDTDNKQDKRFKLANIKGLNKNIQSLFEDEEPAPIETTSGSIAKSNMPLDAMEAPKPRPDFKLDLNDRIAFTQHLFGGSQNDLNEAIYNLNSFSNLDDAKEYLSDIYYEKNWAKSDAYAQRLWSLVENKFL